MTVREFFDLNRDGDIAVLATDDTGAPVLVIERHEHGLTVVDYNSSAEELGYRDDSDRDIDAIVRWWVELWGPHRVVVPVEF